jgi:hypothetical protein
MFFFSKSILAGCGHLTKRTGKIKVLGKIEKIKLDKGVDIPLHCPECLAKMAIRCVKCGGVIFPGDLITLYKPEEIGYDYSNYTTVLLGEKNISVVGCVSVGCSEFSRCAGYWVAPGKFQPFKVVKSAEEFACLE